MERTRLSVVGTVVELDWDEDGNVLALGLETDRDTYEIEGAAITRELSDLVGWKVRGNGWVTDVSEDDLPLLELSDYEALESEDDDEEEDEQEEREYEYVEDDPGD